MKTKVYKTVQGLASQTQQLSFQQVLQGSFCHKKLGWTSFRLGEDTKAQAIEEIVAIIGGHKRDRIKSVLTYDTPHHWALDRMIYSVRGKCWSYCAGQDYTFEMNELRKYLYRR